MDVVKELFDTDNLYEIFEINKTEDTVIDEKLLRSKYMRACLKYHPDKAPLEDRELFTKKFQIIQKIYELFQDNDLRKIYDDTGAWPEDARIELDIASFGRLDENSILEFKKMYQGSDEERQDIKKYYEEGLGDIFHICDNVFFLNVLEDEDRVNSIIENLIENEEMKRLVRGVKSSKDRERKLKKAKKEAAEAEEIMKERNIGNLDDLKKAIAKNSSNRGGNFLADLEKKYGGKSNEPKRSGKKKSDSPDDGPSSKKSKTTTKSKSIRSTRSKSAR